jgi:chromosome partitioning protein
MVQDNAELVGINEIADMAGVSRQVVSNWRARFPTFPHPVAELRSGPVFSRPQVRAWLRTRRVPMAHVVSCINLKGGVGKTHTTVALAEFSAVMFGKKVLVIDLDPQTNATVMMIGDERWGKLNKAGHTLARLFQDALNPEDAQFDLKKTLQKGVSNVREVRSVDLLPSSLDLIDVQDRLASVPSGKFYAINPIDLLRRSIRDIIDGYDLVLVDCPPNLGIITLNGLRLSNGYIIPTIPDFMSTYGIPQIVTRVGDFASQIGEPIEALGIVVSKFRVQNTSHVKTVDQLKKEKDAPLFETIIVESADISKAAEPTLEVSTLTQKYGGRKPVVDDYKALTKELWEKLEP